MTKNNMFEKFSESETKSLQKYFDELSESAIINLYSKIYMHQDHYFPLMFWMFKTDLLIEYIKQYLRTFREPLLDTIEKLKFVF